MCSVSVFMCHHMHEIRGQMVGEKSLLVPFGFWGYKAWWQVPPPTEPSQQPVDFYSTFALMLASSTLLTLYDKSWSEAIKLLQLHWAGINHHNCIEFPSGFLPGVVFPSFVSTACREYDILCCRHHTHDFSCLNVAWTWLFKSLTPNQFLTEYTTPSHPANIQSLLLPFHRFLLVFHTDTMFYQHGAFTVPGSLLLHLSLRLYCPGWNIPYTAG